jgi:hypothetical protein
LRSGANDFVPKSQTDFQFQATANEFVPTKPVLAPAQHTPLARPKLRSAARDFTPISSVMPAQPVNFYVPADNFDLAMPPPPTHSAYSPCVYFDPPPMVTKLEEQDAPSTQAGTSLSTSAQSSDDGSSDEAEYEDIFEDCESGDDEAFFDALEGAGLAGAGTRTRTSKEEAKKSCDADDDWRHMSSTEEKAWQAKKAAAWRQRDNETKKKSPIEVSPNSFMGVQKARKEKKNEKVDAAHDAEVARSIRSILNKLTPEKFESLIVKLTTCGISTTNHIDILVSEVFAKATVQHRNIDMYGELCSRMHKWFRQNTSTNDFGLMFRRMLLDKCYLSFKDVLKTSEDEQSGDEEHVVNKMRTLGTFRFIGNMLCKGMLSSDALILVVDELMADPTGAALECMAVFLTMIGPVFDRAEWTHHKELCEAFNMLSILKLRKDIPARIRFLLQDVLELRAHNWQESSGQKKALRGEAAPTTLEEQRLD